MATASDGRKNVQLKMPRSLQRRLYHRLVDYDCSLREFIEPLVEKMLDELDSGRWLFDPVTKRFSDGQVPNEEVGR